jgi:uncharacterized protein YbjT (DUF2867 family)
MTESTNKLIVVAGATGQQGGAVARHLLKHGWQVRALTRDPNKDAAKALAAQGAELFENDLDDRAGLDRALQGAYGAFSVQNFWLPNVGYEGEVRQGKLFADAAQAAKLEHFVFSSVGSAHRGMGQRHFDSKWEIEQYIQSLGLPYTILRPVFFMENMNYQRAAISNGMYIGMGLPPDKSIQMIAVEDIGAFVALIFENRREFLGKTIEFAGDELTESQIVESLSRVIGRPVTLQAPQMPAGFTPTEEQMAMGNFFRGKAYDADIAALRRRYPGMHTYEQYLRESGWNNLPVMEMPQSGGAWG